MGNQGRVGDRFRKRLRDERKRREWSQEDVAKMLADKGIHGVYSTTIAKIEAGDRAVRIDELTALADIFDMSLDGLIGRNRRHTAEDLTLTLQAYLETARAAASQLAAIETSLSNHSAQLAAFEFEGRKTVIEGCDWVRHVLAQANEVLLVTTRVQSDELNHADTRLWFNEMARRTLSQLEDRDDSPKDGNDEAQP